MRHLYAEGIKGSAGGGSGGMSGTSQRSDDSSWEEKMNRSRTVAEMTRFNRKLGGFFFVCASTARCHGNITRKGNHLTQAEYL